MKTIGWKEHVDFIDFRLYNVPAKIDTGAKTSVLHCEFIELVKVKRKNFVRFIPLDENFEGYGTVHILPYHTERKVKNSFGNEENRFIVKTTISIFNEKHEIEISLRDRSGMEFPMLLGRSFIRKKFLVDVSKSNLSRKETKTK
ncbi:RimK/LysX family protein [Olivibacter sp. XZL3]|uniref:ATP-dependent zinc protease family protein n=1 Tax=Olivibacter sp. XZL3 TaxID=1735116 RepID=UPI0010670511|nr:RimK/LysX family protein [Olivibacter sp. XZL3]